MIDQIDAMRDLWPNANQNMPDEVEISKVFENLQQAVECLDEAFKNEKQLENDLLEFMQIYRRDEDEQIALHGDTSSDATNAHQSNESTQFPNNNQEMNNESNVFKSMLLGKEPSQIQKKLDRDQ